MKKKNQTFTFKLWKQSTYRDNYTPLQHVSVEAELKQKLLKQGYLVLRVDSRKTITVTAICARANVPLKERLKYQKQIDKKNPGKPGDIIKLK